MYFHCVAVTGAPAAVAKPMSLIGGGGAGASGLVVFHSRPLDCCRQSTHNPCISSGGPRVSFPCYARDINLCLRPDPRALSHWSHHIFQTDAPVCIFTRWPSMFFAFVAEAERPQRHCNAMFFGRMPPFVVFIFWPVMFPCFFSRMFI